MHRPDCPPDWAGESLSHVLCYAVWYYHVYLVGGLEHFLCSHILGISSSQLTFIFFRGVAQPPTRYPCSEPLSLTSYQKSRPEVSPTGKAWSSAGHRRPSLGTGMTKTGIAGGSNHWLLEGHPVFTKITATHGTTKRWNFAVLETHLVIPIHSHTFVSVTTLMLV